jgi:hypothetical protein
LTTHLKEEKHGEKGATGKKPATTSRSAEASIKGQAPRKLVRGQDVWLGKGEEQTRQILKCMWCGQSFRSLADLTTHMSETKHYTKVIPQEQLTTWRAQQTASSSPSGCSTPSPSATASSSVRFLLNLYPHSRHFNKTCMQYVRHLEPMQVATVLNDRTFDKTGLLGKL